MVTSYVLKHIKKPLTDYENILNTLNFEILKIPKYSTYNTFFFKLINNKIEESFLLSLIHIKVSNYNICNNYLFYN